MKQIPLNRGLVALVDDADYERLVQFHWHAEPRIGTFYARCRANVGGKQFNLRMHRAILQPAADQEVDHRNGDGLDNQRSNLRTASRSENNANRVRLTLNTSGYRGVSWHAQCGRWAAYITRGGRMQYLGLFDDINDAARAYDAAARKFHGEFARLNFLTDACPDGWATPAEMRPCPEVAERLAGQIEAER